MGDEENINTDDSTGGEIPVISEEDAAALAAQAGNLPDDVDPEKQKGGVQKKIDQLTREKRELERRNAYLEGVAATKAEHKPHPTDTKADTDALDPDDFDDPSDYHRAVAKAETKRLRDQAASLELKKEQDKKSKVMRDQVKLGKEKHEDFEAVALSQGHDVSSTMFEAAMGDTLGDVLYYLGSNPSESNRIASLPPTQQIKEIGKIEAKLSVEPKTKKITDAPNPPTIVGGGGEASQKVKKVNEMSFKEKCKVWDDERRKGAGIK